jgi:hypothetical protein
MTNPNRLELKQTQASTVPSRTNDSDVESFTWPLTSGDIHIEVRDGVCYVNGSPVKPVNPEKDKS